jgi:hypothetical protein
MMTYTKTELEWKYEPAGFLTSTHRVSTASADVVFEGGAVTATLHQPQGPVPEQILEELQAVLDGVLVAQQLLHHKPYRLSGPKIRQHCPDGKIDSAISVSAGEMLIIGEQVDFVITNAQGNVVIDTAAERAAQHGAFIDQVAVAAQKSKLVGKLLASYRTAVADPSNELIHLYEIRDALKKHFGKEDEAIRALGIRKADWKRLGTLANTEPLEEGRHRGRHPSGLRKASQDELNEARRIARALIEAYARTL